MQLINCRALIGRTIIYLSEKYPANIKIIFLKSSQQSINIMLIENIACKIIFQNMLPPISLLWSEKGKEREERGGEGKGKRQEGRKGSRQVCKHITFIRRKLHLIGGSKEPLTFWLHLLVGKPLVFWNYGRIKKVKRESKIIVPSVPIFLHLPSLTNCQVAVYRVPWGNTEVNNDVDMTDSIRQF